MYNGIGMKSTRGTGTNGYVTRNLSAIRPNRRRRRENDSWRDDRVKKRKPNKDILEHKRKREIEVKVFELRDELEEKGMDEEEIDRRCEELRESLKSKVVATKTNDTHTRAKRKEEENAKLKRAFGLDESFVPGRAFDREYQEKAKMERIKEREERARKQRKAERKERKRIKKEKARRKKEMKRERKRAKERERLEEAERKLPKDNDDNEEKSGGVVDEGGDNVRARKGKHNRIFETGRERG